MAPRSPLIPHRLDLRGPANGAFQGIGRRIGDERPAGDDGHGSRGGRGAEKPAKGETWMDQPYSSGVSVFVTICHGKTFGRKPTAWA